MIKFIYLLLLLSLTIYSYDKNKGDYCLYSFSADDSYDAELKLEIKEILKDKIKLLVIQRNGSITVKKELDINSLLNKDNILDAFLNITKTNSKKEIILKNQDITDDYVFGFRGKKYSGYLIKANIEIDKKLYTLTYIFSDEMPLLGLFRFTITQEVKSKKEYKFKNVMLLKECFSKGKILEL